MSNEQLRKRSRAPNRKQQSNLTCRVEHTAALHTFGPAGRRNKRVFQNIVFGRLYLPTSQKSAHMYVRVEPYRELPVACPCAGAVAEGGYRGLDFAAQRHRQAAELPPGARSGGCGGAEAIRVVHLHNNVSYAPVPLFRQVYLEMVDHLRQAAMDAGEEEELRRFTLIRDRVRDIRKVGHEPNSYNSYRALS
eukprot:1195543-Prorocentrum_minimum.AAC.2